MPSTKADQMTLLVMCSPTGLLFLRMNSVTMLGDESDVTSGGYVCVCRTVDAAVE